MGMWGGYTRVWFGAIRRLTENAHLSACGGLSSSFGTAAYRKVRLISQDIGCLASARFPSASHNTVLEQASVDSGEDKPLPAFGERHPSYSMNFVM
jgi:hypothetical protein